MSGSTSPADRHIRHTRADGQAGFIGRERKRLVWRQCDFLAGDFLPDLTVNPFRIAPQPKGVGSRFCDVEDVTASPAVFVTKSTPDPVTPSPADGCFATSCGLS
jgi:hypothetical protein